MHKICKYSRKCAENLQGVAENLQLLQKICSYYKKCAEKLQVLLKMCTKSASIPENVHKISNALQKMCIKSVSIPNNRSERLLLVLTSHVTSHWMFVQACEENLQGVAKSASIPENVQKMCRALLILCTFSVIPADFLYIFCNSCRFSATPYRFSAHFLEYLQIFCTFKRIEVPNIKWDMGTR